MMALFCSAICIGAVGVLCIALFAILFRKFVGIPSSFEVAEQPSDGDAGGGDVDAQTTTVR